MAEYLCNPDGSCSGNCGQGDCEGSRTASCMALGLHRIWPTCTPIRTVNGSESVDRGEVLSIERLDEPLTTPEQAKGWTARLVDFLLALLIVGCLYGAGRALIFGQTPF